MREKFVTKIVIKRLFKYHFSNKMYSIRLILSVPFELYMFAKEMINNIVYFIDKMCFIY